MTTRSVPMFLNLRLTQRAVRERILGLIQLLLQRALQTFWAVLDWIETRAKRFLNHQLEN